MPSPGMDSPYILRLLFPDRNADRNARAFPGPGVFRSTTSRQPPLGSLACRWHESTTSGVAGTSEVLKHQILIYIFFGMC